jgi:hypothetical protein
VVKFDNFKISALFANEVVLVSAIDMKEKFVRELSISIDYGPLVNSLLWGYVWCFCPEYFCHQGGIWSMKV